MENCKLNTFKTCENKAEEIYLLTVLFDDNFKFLVVPYNLNEIIQIIQSKMYLLGQTTLAKTVI